MTSSPWHGGSDIPAEFEATESAEIGPASHVIRAGDCPAAMVTHPPVLSLQPFFSVAPQLQIAKLQRQIYDRGRSGRCA